jgi:hypothetical protein
MDHADDIARLYIESLNLRGSIERIEFTGNDSIEITYDDYRCGCSDINTEIMPIEYLWDENWQDKIPQILEERRLHAERAEAEIERRREEGNRADELKQLAKLKAKYESGDKS